MALALRYVQSANWFELLRFPAHRFGGGDWGEQVHGHDRLRFSGFLRGRIVMKRYVLVLAALVTLSAGAVTTAKAVEFDVGPGGVYVGQHRYHDYDRDRRYYGSYNRCGGGDSCAMWRHECARSWGASGGYEICMQRRAAVVACGRY